MCNCRGGKVRAHGDGRKVCSHCGKVRAFSRPSHGHGMGFNISTRAHTAHKDRKREAKRKACRRKDPRKGGW